MDWFEAPEYWLSRFVFERALGVIYLVAFLVAVNQFRPLLGERGLLPVPRFVRMVRFREAPSLFQLRYSDRLFSVVAWAGVVLANHFAQLVVPFFLFAPQPVAGVAGGIIVLTQSWLILSGNFSWLNFITIVLAIFAFSDTALGHVLPFDRPELVASPHWYE